MKLTKKFFSILMAVIMVMGSVPAGALEIGGADMPVTAYDLSGYNAGDIAALKAIAQEHPTLGWDFDEDPSAIPQIAWNNDNPKRVTALNVSSKSLTGTLDVSGLTKLKYLRCYSNSLTGLNVSELTALEELYCQENSLTELNASGLTALEELYCSYNGLTELSVSGATALQTLYCYNNNLTALDISTLSALQTLNCYNNSLTELDASGLTNLQTLNCYVNSLTSLSVSGLTNLQTLDCGNNSLTELNVSGLTSLQTLDCRYNGIRELEVIGLPVLEALYCSYNRPTSFVIRDLPSLKILNCNNNSFTELDVSKFTTLQTLYCNGNRLTSLDVSGFTDLQTLGCNNNSLTSLNVSGLTALQTLECNNNILTSLDISSLSNLEALYCKSNNMTELDISGNKSLVSVYKDAKTEFVTSMEVGDIRNFTIGNADGWTSDATGVATVYETGVVTAISLGNATLTNTAEISVDNTTGPIVIRVAVVNNLTGYHEGDIAALMEIGQDHPSLGWDFTSKPLTLPGVTWNSENPKRVTELNVSRKTLTGTLDVRALDTLKNLNCSFNSLTSLDVSGLSSLEILNCHSNSLTSLDVSGLDALEYLSCDYNSLTELDVSGLSSLEILSCQSNSLAELDVRGLSELRTLYCDNNDLTKLNVSGLSNLKNLECFSNNLTELDLSGLTIVERLNCHSNSLTSLDVSGLSELGELRCHENRLTELDLGGVSGLKTLYCYDNRLTELDLGGLSDLGVLSCGDNDLTELDLSGLSILIELHCQNNNLTELDISGQPDLEMLNCSNNSLTELDLSGLSYLSELSCRYNSIKALDISHMQVDHFRKDAETEFLTKIPVGEARNFIIGNTDGWTSEDTDVATVDTSGTVTAVSMGSAILTNTANIDVNYSSVQLAIRVKVVYNLSGYHAGDIAALRAIAREHPSLGWDFDEDPAFGSDVTWNSDNPKRVTGLDVSSKALTGALDVSALSSLASLNCSGNSLTSLDVSGLARLVNLSCTNNNMTGLDISSNTKLASVYKDTKTEFLTKIPVSETRNFTIGNASGWTSQNQKAATVDRRGIVTAVYEGSSILTNTAKISVGGTQAPIAIRVEVKGKAVVSVNLNRSATVGVGKTTQLISSVTPADVPNKTLTWSTSNAKIATVDKNGLVKGIGKGTAQITAKSVNGKTATCRVTVYANPKPGNTPFTDINPHWGQKAIEWVYEQRLFNGTSETKFSPNADMTRAMAVTVLYRIEGNPKVSGGHKFSDVPEKSYYANAVKWAYQNGIVNGTSPTTFSPHSSVTREQFAVMLYNYTEYCGGNLSGDNDLSAFSDADKVSEFAKAAMRWAVANRYLNGKGGGILDPTGTATRAEIATLLMNYLV